jgi:hypothetical protein
MGVPPIGCRRHGYLERQKQNYAPASEHVERAIVLARATFIPDWLGNLHLGLAKLALVGIVLTTQRFCSSKLTLITKTRIPGTGRVKYKLGWRDAVMRAAGSQECPELARAVHREAIAAAYSRDAAFANKLLNGQLRPRNVLMFI